MIVDSLTRQCRFEYLSFRWFRITRLEEPLRILGPCDTGESHPFHFIGKILLRIDLADVQRLPVRTSFGDAIREPFTVWRRTPIGKRHRPVRRQHVGIDDDRGLSIERSANVKRRLPLKPTVLYIEIASALAPRNARFGVIPQLRDALLEVIPHGKCSQLGVRHLVLGSY